MEEKKMSSIKAVMKSFYCLNHAQATDEWFFFKKKVYYTLSFTTQADLNGRLSGI